MVHDNQPDHPITMTRRKLLAGAAGVSILGAAAVATAGHLEPAMQAPQPQKQAGSAGPLPEIVPSPSTQTELTEEQKLRHLLRRAGFGASPEEFAECRSLGLNGAVDRLIEYEAIDNTALEQRLSGLSLDLTRLPDAQRWWLLRMIYTARPLEEKLTLFWHGLLTSANSKIGRPDIMIQQNRFLRANALGRFPDILKGISREPAMIAWLDLHANRRSHPNENYARELMELFSLGVGNYTEEDVKEAARAYTGWTYNFDHKFTLDRRQHDEGTKTVLGTTGNLDGDAVVDILVQQPASARFIARRLFGFLAYPNPSDEVLAPLVESYTSSGYSVKALVRAILTSDAFSSPAAYRALVKGPAELVAGAARVLGIETDGRGLPQATSEMGQQLLNPPNVAGWPGGAAWLSSGTWFARVNLASRVAGAASYGPPQKGAATATGPNLDRLLAGSSTPGDIADRLIDLLLDGSVDPDQRQALVEYLIPPASFPSQSVRRSWLDERHRGALYLVMATPQYNLS